MRSLCEGDIVSKILEAPDTNNEEILDGTDDEKTNDKGARKDLKPLVKGLPILGSLVEENEKEDDIHKILDGQKELRSTKKRELAEQAALAAEAPKKKGRKPKNVDGKKGALFMAKRKNTATEEEEGGKDAVKEEDEFSMEDAQTRSDQIMKEEREKEDEEEEGEEEKNRLKRRRAAGSEGKVRRQRCGAHNAKDAKEKKTQREVEDKEPKAKEAAKKLENPEGKPKDWTILCVCVLFLCMLVKYL